MSNPIEFKPPKVQLNLPWLASVPVLIVGALIAAFIVIWVFCRIEPGAGEIAVASCGWPSDVVFVEARAEMLPTE